ncbi:MAG: RNA methyltransferase [Bacteroidales bacterium]
MKKLSNDELNRHSIEEFKKLDKIPLVVVLDNVRSSQNIGSVFRTSDAFLVEEILLCGICATPPNNDIRKSALGAENSVDWRYFKDTRDAVGELKAKGYTVAAIEQVETSVSLNELDLAKKEKIAVIFGHEVKGVSQEIVGLCDIAIEVPQFGTKHSLNISVCAGIVIWELFSKLGTTS